MNICYLFILLVGMLTTNVASQKLPKAKRSKDSHSVVLRGEVKSINVEETSSVVELIVNLKLELLNSGSRPVILLEARPPVLRGAALAKNPDDLLSLKNLVLEYHGESVDTSAEWVTLRKELDQPSPPLDKVRVLMPNEFWKWEDSVGFSLLKDPVNNYFLDKRETWKNIKQMSIVWLRAICQVWSLNLESRSGNDRTEKPFGHKLQTRWENVGLLWLDDIQSEPILLDLRTAVVH